MKTESKNNHCLLLCGAFGLFCGITAYLMRIVSLSKDDLNQTYAYTNAARNGMVSDLLIAVGAALVGAFALYIVSRRISFKPLEKRSLSKRSELKIWGGSALIMMICWLPYLLAYYPGAVLPDTTTQLYEVFSGNYSNHHPLMYTLLIGFILKLGFSFGLDMNSSVFLYTVLQSIVLSFILGYAILWLYKNGVPKWFCFFVLVYYSLAVFFPTYAINMQKDTLFTSVLCLFSFFIYDAFIQDGPVKIPTLLKLGFSALLVAFFRNNGIYIIAATLVFTLMIGRKKKLLYSGILFFVVLFHSVVTGPLYNYYGIYSPTEESFGIVIQQFAYTAIEEPETLNEVELSAVDGVFPIEKYPEVYNALNVDSIKWNPSFQKYFLSKNKFQILQIWAYMIPRHFNQFFKAYCLQTTGFWHPVYQTGYGYLDTYIFQPNPEGIVNTDLLKKYTGIEFQPVVDALKTIKISSGLFFIMMMSCGFIYATRQRRRSGKLTCLWLLLPAFLCWGTIMVATPVAFSLRYVLILVFQLPVYLSVALFL